MAEPTDYDRGEADENDDDDEVGDTGYKSVKDAVLFAIDVSKTMLRPPPDTGDKKMDRDSATVAALRCASSLMQQRIISNPSDMMGVLLFGTEKSRFQDQDEHSNGLSYPHCYLLADLDVPSAPDVRRLRDLVSDDQPMSELLQASDEPVSMANVLFCANQIFTTRAPNFSSRRLFLITDDDDPHATDKASRSAAAVRAKDLYDLGVVIELFPIARPDHEFDRSIFYDDIIYSSIPADPDAPAPLLKASKASSSGNGITLLQSLLSNVASKSAPRRALFSNLNFELGPDVKISVKGFIIFKRQEPIRSTYVDVSGERAQIAVGSSTLMADDTARTVEKVEVRKAYKFGGETITFSQEELAEIKNFGEPVLRIIGFKPLAMLSAWASTRPATFIYPSEEEYIGSTRVFAALQQKMLKSQKMAVAWYIPRRNATPTLVTLLPGAERLDDDDNQIIPPGLWIHPLPFADDVRSPPDVSLIRSPDQLIDLMRTVIQQLHLPKGVYDPQKYSNPSLQWFYRILQALALDEDLPEPTEDKTLPRYRQIDKRAGHYVTEWGQELEQQYRTWQKTSAGTTTAMGSTKRGSLGELTNGHATTDGVAKRTKTSSVAGSSSTSDAVTDDEMRRHFEKNSIHKLTVAVLKAWLHAKAVPVKAGSKKTDYVDQVTSYFEHDHKMDIS